MPRAHEPDQHQVIDALWAKGVLWWKLKPVQKLMHQREVSSDSMLCVDNCARQLGKSFRLCARAIGAAISISEAIIPFAAPTLKMIRNITIPIFREICQDAPADVRPIFIKSEGKFVFPHNNSEIVLAGVNNDHADDLRGRKAHLAIIDEGGFIDDLEYLIEDIISPQLLTTNGKIIMASSPSRTPAHPFKKYCAQALREGCYSEYDIYQAGYSQETIERFKKKAGGENSTTWKREYLCQFVVDENYAIIPEWRAEYEKAIPRDDYFRFYHLYEFMDMGVKDKTVVIFAYYDFLNARLVIIGELVMNGPQMTTEKLAAAIKVKENTLWAGRKVHRRIADNNNPLLLQDLGSLHKIYFQPTQKDGKTEKTTILEAMVNELRIQVGAGRIVVDPSCIETIGCLKFGIWNEHRTTFERVEEFGHFDAVAALIYGNRDIDRHTNPIPANLNISLNTHYITPSVLRDPTVESVKKMLNIKRRRRE